MSPIASSSPSSSTDDVVLSKMLVFELNIKNNPDSNSMSFITNVASGKNCQSRTSPRVKLSRSDSHTSLTSQADQSLSTASLTLVSESSTRKRRNVAKSLQDRISVFNSSNQGNSPVPNKIEFNDSELHGSSSYSLRPESWHNSSLKSIEMKHGDLEDFYASFTALRPGSFCGVDVSNKSALHLSNGELEASD